MHLGGKNSDFGIRNIVSNYSFINYEINYTTFFITYVMSNITGSYTPSPQLEKRNDGGLRRLMEIIV